MFLYHLWLCSYFLLSVSSLPVDSEENEQSVIRDSREHIHNPSVDNLAKAWEKLERAQRTRFGLDETARNLSKSSIFSEIYTVRHVHSYTYSRSAIYSITQLGLVNV